VMVDTEPIDAEVFNLMWIQARLTSSAIEAEGTPSALAMLSETKEKLDSIAQSITNRLNAAQPARPVVDREAVKEAIQFGMMSKVLFPFVGDGQAIAAVDAVTNAVMALLEGTGETR
jgi:hypothetical protein